MHKFDFQNNNYWINFNKPAGFSSAYVVNLIKKTTKAKKVGHGGTLDPFASGVLPIAINKATKQSNLIMDFKKKYAFKITFGEFRDSDDISGNIVESNNKRVSKNRFAKSLIDFIGNIKQTPSKFSAIKINGIRSYELARKGKEYLMPIREVTIYNLKLINFNEEFCDMEVECSKGTYIRSLARNICETNGICGYVSKLSRLEVGDFLIKNTISLDELKNIINLGQSLKNGSLLDLQSMLSVQKMI
jgi:tRNA pseudouridine55 synthase